MKAVSWTEEQKKAINTRNCNLLVAAAAGSGKTAVLVERIIRIITSVDNPIDIDKLLVVTFTNAAASEMRERIAKALIRKLESEPGSSRLQRQLALLPKSSITTLHSFCLEVIRNNFHILGLNPDFRISDDTENILLKQESIDELFEEKYNDEANEEFLGLVEFYCNSKEDVILQDMVLDLYNSCISFPAPEYWLRKSAEMFNLKGKDIKDLDYLNNYIDNVLYQMGNIEKCSAKAINIIDSEDTLEPYKEAYLEDLYAIKNLISKGRVSFDDFIEGINEFDFVKLKRCKKDVNKDKQERVKSLRDDIKKQLNNIKSEVAQLKSESIVLDFNNLYPVMRTLCNLVIEFKEHFERKKRDRSIIDFNDFEHMCLKILSRTKGEGEIYPSEIAIELKKKYEEIFIDEYQDTNSIQDKIINLISRGTSFNKNGEKEIPNVFMVGDIKQSIYKFRQAKPELFLQKYNNYKEDESRFRKIMLYKNFRSREKVINGVNFIFKQIMSEKVGELEYNDGEMLNLGADFKKTENQSDKVGGAVELHLIENNLDNEIEEDNPDSIQLEARMVSSRIKSLLDSKDGEFKVYDKELNEYRKVTYKDIVILLRSTQKWAPIFMDELKNYDIPSYADAGTGYFDAVEIKVMLSLLQIIDNPMQDIPLLSVMTSIIGGFTQEDIIDIKAASKEDSYYEKLMDILENSFVSKEKDELYDNNELDLGKEIIEKTQGFLKLLEEWRNRSSYMPLDEFIWYLYKTTGYYGYVGAMPLGEQRQANLKILFQRAKQYERTSYKGLFNFINFIDKLKKNNTDLGSAKIASENQNVVRIMSIHKSKGLEFPVVILSGLGKKFNLMDINKKLLFHENLGLGPDAVDLKRRIAYPSLMKTVIRKKTKLEILSEEMRILYVALTRAKEKLILTGLSKDLEKSSERWAMGIEKGSTKLSSFSIENANNYLDWIGPCVMRSNASEVLLAKTQVEYIEKLESQSEFEVKLWQRSELLKENTIEEKEDIVNSNVEEFTITKEYEKIDNILSSKYAFEKSSKIPTIITVTELKRKFNDGIISEYANNLFVPKLIKVPRFLEETKKLSASQKGTAMHAVMQRLDLSNVLSEEDIKIQIENMVFKEFITKEEAQTVNVKKIINFFKSDLGKRMISSTEVKREIPFHLEIKSTEVYKNLPKEIYENEKLMLQGIIDCYFIEGDNIILIDYKTDYVESVFDIKEKYKIQVEYYSKVLEKITGMKVSEKYLYLFYNNSSVLI
ncbi:helicase-exonuclease AddAB subunit AddA [Haloimpatiens sp. FM7315]|uniref:helicase-exonuclease AddAB subunit AddA n=1 Tax=Haloimpatiens sp. FM7315 TaxID=3298609 RepID=UPI00370BDC34